MESESRPVSMPMPVVVRSFLACTLYKRVSFREQRSRADGRQRRSLSVSVEALFAVRHVASSGYTRCSLALCIFCWTRCRPRLWLRVITVRVTLCRMCDRFASAQPIARSVPVAMTGRGPAAGTARSCSMIRIGQSTDPELLLLVLYRGSHEGYRSTRATRSRTPSCAATWPAAT